MTPEQALENLNQAAGQLQLTREQHLILAKSVERIRAVLTELETSQEARRTLEQQVERLTMPGCEMKRKD